MQLTYGCPLFRRNSPAYRLAFCNEVAILNHPNQRSYPGQKISVVIIEDYAYLVPFIEDEDEIFLKTIIPSRKATKQYVGNSDE